MALTCWWPPEFPETTDDYNVLLPKCVWYDFWTGERIAREGSTTDQAITIAPILEMLPVYARGGTVILEAPLTQSTSEKPQGPLTLRVYPDANHGCAGTIYDDDGTSYAFEHGGFLRMDMTCTAIAGGMTLHYSAHQGSYPAWWSTLRVELYGLHGQPTVLANGRVVTTAQSPPAAPGS